MNGSQRQWNNAIQDTEFPLHVHKLLTARTWSIVNYRVLSYWVWSDSMNAIQIHVLPDEGLWTERFWLTALFDDLLDNQLLIKYYVHVVDECIFDSTYMRGLRFWTRWRILVSSIQSLGELEAKNKILIAQHRYMSHAHIVEVI